MRAALIVVDMVRDTLEGERTYPITRPARAIVPAINDLAEWLRARGMPVVFACDSFLPGDFIFNGRLKEHSLRGTDGCRPSRLLEVADQDTVLYKRRFSAFFKTDLDQTLRTWGVECLLVGGISSHFCVLHTVLDGLCHDFRAVLLEDASAAPSQEIHRAVLSHYRDNPLYPLLRVMTCEQIKEGGLE